MDFEKVLNDNKYTWADIIIFCTEEDGQLLNTLQNMHKVGYLEGIDSTDELHELHDHIMCKLREAIGIKSSKDVCPICGKNLRDIPIVTAVFGEIFCSFECAKSKFKHHIDITDVEQVNSSDIY
jgi:hypothetical protein